MLKTILEMFIVSGTSNFPAIHGIRFSSVPIIVWGHEITHSWLLPVDEHPLHASDHQMEEERHLGMVGTISHPRIDKSWAIPA